jgi:hypothetical protein
MIDPRGFGSHILAMVTRNLLRVAEAEGLDADRLLERAGLSRSGLVDPDAYLPIERHIALGRAISEGLGAINGGLRSGAAIYGDPRGALGFTIRRSSTHARALECFRRFVSVTNECVRLGLDPTAPGGVALHAEMVSGLAELGHPAEALLSAWVSIARIATGQRWTPERVLFAHAARGPSEEHVAFFGCPVQFGAERSSLQIGAAALALPIAATPHELDATLTELGESLRACAPPGEIAELLAWIKMGALEPQHAISPRVRLAAARLLLSGSATMPTFEAAFLLGYGSVRELRSALDASAPVS